MLPGSASKTGPGGSSSMLNMAHLSRNRLVVILVVLSLVLLLWSYIYCVSVVVYNYLWWVLFSGTVHEASLETAASHEFKSTPVPKIIHQTWKDKHVPEVWKAAQKSCKDLHPDYEYKLWTDDDARELITSKFPWFLDTYNGYTHSIQRADAMRYFVLYEYGGLYLDLDVKCLKNLDHLRHFNFTAPKTYPVGLSNDVMVAQKRDPFSYRLIHHLKDWNHWFFFKYATVMFSTGPMFVTVQYVLHHMKQGIFVLPTDLYGKYQVTSARMFDHLHGSSWHGKDARMVFFFEHHWKLIVVAGTVAVLGAAWYLLIKLGYGQTLFGSLGYKKVSNNDQPATANATAASLTLTSIQCRKD